MVVHETAAAPVVGGTRSSFWAFLVDGNRVIGHVGMKNAGNLPARKVSWFVRIKESPDGEETDFPIENSKGKIVIVPKADITKTGQPGAPLLEMQAILIGL